MKIKRTKPDSRKLSQFNNKALQTVLDAAESDTPIPLPILEKNHKDFAEESVENLNQDHNRKAQAIEQRASQILSLVVGHDVDEQIDTSKKSAQVVMINATRTMIETKESEEQKRRQYLATVSKYGASQENDDEGSGRLWAMILFLLVAESAISGWSLGVNAEGGWVYGAIQALLISGLSIAMSFGVGQLLRALYGKQWYRKIAIVAIAVLSSASLFSYHVVIGWMRTLLEHSTTPDAAMETAIDFFLKYHFALKDLNSWFLVLTGVLFSLTAAFAGWQHLEARNRSRVLKAKKRYWKARDSVNTIYNKATNQLVDLFNKGENRVFTLLEEGIAAVANLNEVVYEAKSLKHSSNRTIKKANADYENSVSFLRDNYYHYCGGPKENESHRTEGDTDLLPLDLENYALHMPASEEAAEICSQQTQAVKSLKEKARQARACMSTERNKVIDELAKSRTTKQGESEATMPTNVEQSMRDETNEPPVESNIITPVNQQRNDIIVPLVYSNKMRDSH